MGFEFKNTEVLINNQSYYADSVQISENADYDYDKDGNATVAFQPQGSVDISFYVTSSQEITNIENSFGSVDFVDLDVGSYTVTNAIVNSFSIDGEENDLIKATVQYDYYAETGKLSAGGSSSQTTGITISPAHNAASTASVSDFTSTGILTFSYSHSQEIEVTKTSTGANFAFTESTKNLTFTLPTEDAVFNKINLTQGYQQGSLSSVFQQTNVGISLNDLCQNSKGSISVAGNLTNANFDLTQNEDAISQLSVTQKYFGDDQRCDLYVENLPVSIGSQTYYANSIQVSENADYDYDKDGNATVAFQPQGSVDISFYVTEPQEITNIESGFSGANFVDLGIGPFEITDAIPSSFSVNGGEDGVVTATVQYDYYAEKGKLTSGSSSLAQIGNTISPAYSEASIVNASDFASTGILTFNYSHVQEIEVTKTSTGVNFSFTEGTKNLTFALPTKYASFNRTNLTEGYQQGPLSSVFQQTNVGVSLNDLCENAKGSLSVVGNLIDTNLDSEQSEDAISQLSVTQKYFGDDQRCDLYVENLPVSIGSQAYYANSIQISENADYDYDEYGNATVAFQPQGSVDISFYVTTSQEITNIESSFSGANFINLGVGPFEITDAIPRSFSVNGGEDGVVTATVQYDYYAEKGKLTSGSSSLAQIGNTISPAYSEASIVNASDFTSSGILTFDYSNTQEIEVTKTSTGVNFSFTEGAKNLTFTLPTKYASFNRMNLTEGYQQGSSSTVFQQTNVGVSLNDLCENAKGSLSVVGNLIDTNLDSEQSEDAISQLSVTQKYFKPSGSICEQFFENISVSIGGFPYYASSIDISENIDYNYSTPLGSTSKVQSLTSAPVGNVNIDFYITHAGTISNIDNLIGGLNYVNIIAGPYNVTSALINSLSVNGSSGSPITASASFNFYPPNGNMQKNSNLVEMNTGIIYPAYGTSSFNYSASQDVQNKETITGSILSLERVTRNFTQKRKVLNGAMNPLLNPTITQSYTNTKSSSGSPSTTLPPVDCQIANQTTTTPPSPPTTGAVPSGNPFQTLSSTVSLEDLCGNPKGTLYLQGLVVDQSFGASESDDIEESVTIENVTLATGCP